jgi:integrase
MMVGALWFWRGAATSNVILRADSVELRGVVWTRRIPLRELASVTVATGRTGMNGFSREYLVLHRRNGTDSSFKELNSKRAKTLRDGPRIRLHDLRHSHATLGLASGIPAKVMSERLGHSKVGITLDLYSHVTPGMQEDAARSSARSSTVRDQFVTTTPADADVRPGQASTSYGSA